MLKQLSRIVHKLEDLRVEIFLLCLKIQWYNYTNRWLRLSFTKFPSYNTFYLRRGVCLVGHFVRQGWSGAPPLKPFFCCPMMMFLGWNMCRHASLGILLGSVSFGQGSSQSSPRHGLALKGCYFLLEYYYFIIMSLLLVFYVNYVMWSKITHNIYQNTFSYNFN